MVCAITARLATLLWLAALLSSPAAWSDVFTLPSAGNDLVGRVQRVPARYWDTLLDIARRHDLGYLHITRANPGVDPWLPGEGREVILPTRYVLPAAPRTGIVLNIAEMRLYYYPPPKPGEQPRVIVHPIGIGRDFWNTPLGATRVVGKQTDPSWRPPESIRAEYAAEGERLPRVVSPGPDNPLGRFALRLAWPGYLIHGTNKPYGVGMRVSHGCIHLYPEDIERLFPGVAAGTPVYVVNQPYKAGWFNNVLYLQAYPPLVLNGQTYVNTLTPAVQAVTAVMGDRQVKIDWNAVMQGAIEARGIPVAVSRK